MGAIIYMVTLPCVCMAAQAAAGALLSYNMDLTSEFAAKFGAFEAKVTADKGRGSTLHEAHAERLLL